MAERFMQRGSESLVLLWRDWW